MRKLSLVEVLLATPFSVDFILCNQNTGITFPCTKDGFDLPCQQTLLPPQSSSFLSHKINVDTIHTLIIIIIIITIHPLLCVPLYQVQVMVNSLIKASRQMLRRGLQQLYSWHCLCCVMLCGYYKSLLLYRVCVCVCFQHCNELGGQCHRTSRGAAAECV